MENFSAFPIHYIELISRLTVYSKLRIKYLLEFSHPLSAHDWSLLLVFWLLAALKSVPLGANSMYRFFHFICDSVSLSLSLKESDGEKNKRKEKMKKRDRADEHRENKSRENQPDKREGEPE